MPSRALARATRDRLAAVAAEWTPGERPADPPPPSRAAWRIDGRARRALGALLAAALAVAAWSWWNGRPLEEVPVPGAVPGAMSSAMSGALAATAVPALGGEVVVHVTGAVRAPGVVTLPAGSRVSDAIEAAGGATKARALDSVNLARVLVDGEQVVVGGAGAGAGATASSLLPLNTADAPALEAMPGIGPVLAQRIVDWRAQHGPFASADALGDVPGIGPSLLAQLRPLVTVP